MSKFAQVLMIVSSFYSINSLIQLWWCNVRSVTRTVVVVVMLADYLPEMQRVHLITLIIMIGIVNLFVRIHRQVFLSV